MIGDKTMDFDTDGNIIIGGVNYGHTEGLYELIFKNVPDKDIITEEDMKTYKSILMACNAHRERYKYNGKLRGTRGTKYKKFIRTLFPPLRGKGVEWKNEKSRDIIYWDDINELVARLKHICMSTETGNRVHANEIISIIEELREAGYIRGAGNSRYKSLLK